jgi:outer membrane cobalamin receptor
MKRAVKILSLCMFACNLYAQHTLTGTVKDQADGSAVAYATVALLTPDSSIITGATTDDTGRFALQNIAAGNYLAQVSFIGYEKEYRQVNIPSQSDLGAIELKESANKLSEVVVTASRPFIERRTDRYVVNVGSHILTAGRNALDVLRNTPGVLVKSDGSISVMGNHVEIWIDGRPSNLSGEQLKSLLTSTQGETIDRIEVITNPSSRYDAAGIGGIINIRTKRGLQYGLNGSTNAGYTQSRVDVENAGLQLNYRNSVLNVYGNYGITRHNDYNSIKQINIIETTEGPVTFDQYTHSKFQKAQIRHQFRMGTDFFLSTNSTLGFLLNVYENGKSNRYRDGDTYIMPPSEGIGHTATHNMIFDRGNGRQANVNFQQTFSQPGQQLNIDLDIARFKSSPSQETANTYYDAVDVPTGDVEQLRHKNPQTIDIYSGKLDYTHPLGENGKLETGVKSGSSKTDNDRLYEEYVNPNWETYRNRTNHFIYTEQVHAAYLNLSRSWGKWSVQAGLRGEYTLSKGEQRTTGAVNDSSYFNLFPTLFVNYAPDEYTLSFSYSRRLRRPSYGQLNPFEIKLDAYSYVAGNPHLTPNYRQMLELSYMNRHNLMITLSYNYSTDLIVMMPVVDASDNVRYGMVPVNFGTRINIGGMISYRFMPVKRWTVTLMAEGGYITNRSGDASDKLANDGMIAFVFLNNAFDLGRGFSVEVNGIYNTGQKTGYMESASAAILSAGIRKSLLNDKLMLSLNAEDIFNSALSWTTVKYGNVNDRIFENPNIRSIALSLRYNFGSSTVKASRRRSSGIEEEAGRAR